MQTKKDLEQIEKIKNEIILKVKENMLDDFTRENIYNDVKTLLKEYHQKPLGKKFLKDLEKLIPDSYLRSIGPMVQIEIPEGYVSHRLGHETHFKMSILLTHGETFNFDDLDRKNTCYLESHHERIKKNKKFLKNTKLVEKTAQNILALKKCHAFFTNELDSFDVPSCYTIRKISGLKIELIKD